MPKLLLVVVLIPIVWHAVYAQNSNLVGDWDVSLVKTKTKESPPWLEIKYPVRMSIREENGKLMGAYTDQYDYSDNFSFLTLQQNEILFVLGGVGKKNIMFFGPVHRAILKDGVLHGFVFTDRKLFEWTATKRRSASG